MRWMLWTMCVGAMVAAGCESTPKAEKPPQTALAEQEPTYVEPTAEDAALLERYERSMAELYPNDPRTREPLNHTLEGWTAKFRQRLAGELPATAKQMRQARNYVRRQVGMAEQIAELPAPRPTAIPRRRADVVIDGRLDDAEWAHAPRFEIDYVGIEQLEGNVATARVQWDERFLYVAAEVPDRNILAPLLRRDANVFQHDCVELFLMPDAGTMRYWELNISPNGSLLDNLATKHPTRWGSEADMTARMEGLRVGLHVDGTMNDPVDVDRGYVVEVAIPWSQLPDVAPPLEAGRKIHVLIGRVNRHGEGKSAKVEYISHVPCVGWFHNVWCYAPLVME